MQVYHPQKRRSYNDSTMGHLYQQGILSCSNGDMTIQRTCALYAIGRSKTRVPDNELLPSLRLRGRIHTADAGACCGFSQMRIAGCPRSTLAYGVLLTFSFTMLRAPLFIGSQLVLFRRHSMHMTGIAYKVG